MLSPDEDFSQTGVHSGIMYAESFKKYKEMLTGDANSSTFERIFSEFNASLFGTVPTLSNDLILDDGNYDSELEQFRNELLADSPIEAGTGTGANNTSPPSPLPASPLHPDQRVSISATSHVSHTVVASSQVSNTINNTIVLPLEPEVIETSPPSPEAVQLVGRPAPKKKGTKPSRSTSDADANTIPTQKKRAARQAKTVIAPEEHPDRVLRKRT